MSLANDNLAPTVKHLSVKRASNTNIKAKSVLSVPNTLTTTDLATPLFLVYSIAAVLYNNPADITSSNYSSLERQAKNSSKGVPLELSC